MSVNIPVPSNECDRLQTLKNLVILDTAPEAGFDHITSLAADIFDAPIALVSLVDENRQWFKSRHGLAGFETPRDLTFCAYAIMQEHVFYVPDATEDYRFADNALVSAP